MWSHAAVVKRKYDGNIRQVMEPRRGCQIPRCSAVVDDRLWSHVDFPEDAKLTVPHHIYMDKIVSGLWSPNTTHDSMLQ